MPTPRKYGWIRPKLPTLQPLHAQLYGLWSMASLPARVNLSMFDSQVYDQGQTSSCTGYGWKSFLEHLLKRAGRFFEVSAYAIYAWERMLEGTLDQDCGASIADGARVVSTRGIPAYHWWNDMPSMLFDAPTEPCITEAARQKLLDPSAVAQDDQHMMSCLAAGDPFNVGISVYESFEDSETERTGVVKMPEPGEQLMGGHDIMVMGYDAVAQLYDWKGSYGPDWGIRGYGKIPFAYLSNSMLSDDRQTGRTIS